MDTSYLEVDYPISFRQEDAKNLGGHLRLRHSVELVGMKRVGISNFLRFFFNHPKIVETYINRAETHLFIPVDLNDLVEIEIFPFWILTFKRLVDKVGASDKLMEKTKKEISVLFLDAIQSQDLFLAVDGLRKALILICENGVLPALFYLRFDRIGPVINEEFFANLVGLRDATAERLAYVFSSFRTLEQIAPKVFERKLLSEFSHPMYIKPANAVDASVIFERLAKKYGLASGTLEERILELCGGHVQYLQLASIVLNHKKVAVSELTGILEADERIRYLGDEIWESLAEVEQKVLVEVHKGQRVSESERETAKYLWETGMLLDNHKSHIFGKLFEAALSKRGSGANGNGEEKVEFTKKEHALYNFLLSHKDEVCERERIIEAVWSEVEDLGVSDWTIDRLVARLRTKLKKQGSQYQVVTVKTRGYKLIQ